MANERQRGRPPHDDVLTPAEWRVAEAVRHGLSNPEIARRQGVSTDAVKYHVANALQKLGLSRRAELRHWTGIRRDSNLFIEPSCQESSQCRWAVDLEVGLATPEQGLEACSTGI